MRSAGRISVLKALDIATGVKAISDRAIDLRSDDVAEPDDLPLHCSSIVTDSGTVVVVPEDGSDEVSAWLDGAPAASLDGAVIESDTLLNLEGWR